MKKKTFPIISLGQFICENVCIVQTENDPYVKSGQILTVQIDFVERRSANPYLEENRKNQSLTKIGSQLHLLDWFFNLSRLILTFLVSTTISER